MPGHRRGPWSQDEDDRLLQFVNTHGPHYWVRISQMLGSRSPKQCRERYHQNLKPSLNHQPITPEEGELIEQLVHAMGKRWAEIARRLRGRSDNAVKNWWNGGMNRRRRLCRTAELPATPRREHAKLPEPLSYAHSHHPGPAPPPLGPIRTTVLSSAARSMDTAVPSPSAMSDVSHADSAETAPSLVSDVGSYYTTSPCLSSCPPAELPPAQHTLPRPASMHPHEGRRRSVPALKLETHNYLSPEHEAHPSASLVWWPYPPRSDHERKAPEMLQTPHASPPSFRGRPLPLPPPAPSPYSAPDEARSPIKPEPLEEPAQQQSARQPIQLPSCQALIDAVDGSGARDARGSLTNILT